MFLKAAHSWKKQQKYFPEPVADSYPPAISDGQSAAHLMMIAEAAPAPFLAIVFVLVSALVIATVACNLPHSPMTTPAIGPAAISHNRYSNCRHCCYRTIEAPGHLV